MQELGDLEEQRQSVFRRVKPYCVSLLEWFPDPSPTGQNDLTTRLEALLECLNTLGNPQTILNESLIQYITFPLLQTFTKGCLTSDAAISLILKCVDYLIDTCFQKLGIELQVRLFLITLEFLGEESEVQCKTLGISGSLSEELKLQAAQMQVRFFFTQNGSSGFFLNTEGEISQRRTQLIVARLIHTFIHCISSEKLLDLRLLVLKNFNQLISVLDSTDILAQFFPGIVTGLSSIILDNIDRGHSRLLSSLLNALEKAIVCTLNDNVNTKYITSIASLAQLEIHATSDAENTENNSSTSQPTSPETFQKNSDWVKAAQIQTKTLLIKVLRTRSHPDWKVRNACLKLCFNTIAQCHRLLHSCFSVLIETLVLGLKDSYAEIATTAKEYIEILSHDSEIANLTLSYSKQNFYNLIDSLPGTLTRQDELMKYNALSLCALYLQIISHDIDEFLATNFNNFISSLLPSLELDDSDIQLLETRTLDVYDTASVNSKIVTQKSKWIWMPSFKNIHEDRTSAQLSMMFRSFGYYGNIMSLVDTLLSRLRSTKSARHEVVYIYIINELLKGADDRISSHSELTGQLQDLSIGAAHVHPLDDEELGDRTKITKSVARAILREYLARWSDEATEADPLDSSSSGELLYETHTSLFDPKSTQHFTNTQPSVHYFIRIHEILATKSILYGTACIAQILGLDFRLELLNVLYPLMEMMGHESTVIYDSAICCAESIRLCCHYRSVRDMIAENADYLVNAMSHKFAFAMAHSQVPQVLRAFLCILGTEALPLIEDITDDILDTLDSNRDRYEICSQLLGALDDFLGLTLDVIRATEDADETEDCAHKTPEVLPLFGNFLAWYKADAEESDLLLETLYASQPPDTTASDVSPDTHKADQSRVSMTITRKSILFLTAQTSKMRSLAINIFGKGLKIVDKSEVYSLINDAWPSLYYLLESKESMLVFKTVRLIQDISREYADFTSKRFVSQIWPYFARFFNANRSQLLVKRGSLEPSFHPDHHESRKLLAAILEATSSMLLHLNIPIQQVRSICETVAPIASNDADPQIQQAISRVFTSVARRFPDVLWVFLNSGERKPDLDPLSPQLRPVSFPSLYNESMQQACHSLRYLLGEEEQR